jgi:hypothetical protein
MTSAARYQDDVVVLATEQARFLREGRLDLLDIAHLAEEIEDVGPWVTRVVRHGASAGGIEVTEGRPGVHPGATSGLAAKPAWHPRW